MNKQKQRDTAVAINFGGKLHERDFVNEVACDVGGVEKSIPIPILSQVRATVIEPQSAGAILDAWQYTKQTAVVFNVSNPNRFPVKIVGHKLSCSCLRDIKYPTVIGSKGNATIQIQFAGESPGPIDKNFRLFFSGVGLNVVSVSINGRVMPKEST